MVKADSDIDLLLRSAEDDNGETEHIMEGPPRGDRGGAAVARSLE